MQSKKRALTAVLALLVLIIIQAAADPTGLLALVPWSGALPSVSAGLWSFAPYLIFLPVVGGLTWWTASRAGNHFWTLAIGVTMAVLLAQAATALVMVWDLTAAGYAAGFVAGKALPAGLIVAAGTYWLGGPRIQTKHGVGPTRYTALSFGVLAPFLAGLWWTGAAYAPHTPNPRMDATVISIVLGVVLLTLAMGAALRLIRPLVPGFLGTWLSAVVAGGLFGLSQLLISLFTDHGLTGDLWPLVSGYISVADGLAYGAVTGWIFSLIKMGNEAIRRNNESTRTPDTVVAALGTVAVLAAIILPNVGVNPGPAAPIAGGFLQTRDGIITDDQGNQVLLRGVNVNNLVDFYAPQPDVPATTPLSEDDFAAMASYGFNVVRLNISWSALEPTRGTLDPAYLAEIKQSVMWAKQYGMYTVLDMHQDGWWNGPTTPGTSCRPGTEEMWGYDGAPGWATFTDSAPRCQFTGRDISPAGNRAFQNFYFNTDDIRVGLAQTWGKLAALYKDEPMVAGFDLLNEPGFGETAPVTTSHLLAKFYDEATAEIRAAGANQIIFFEPSIFWSGLGIDTGPAPGFTMDNNIVFSPHLYAEAITMDSDWPIPPFVGLERQFDLAERVAAQYGEVPVWSGEYGKWGTDQDVIDWVNRYAAAEDNHLIGSAYWVWKQACGDPQNGIGPVGNALIMQNCEGPAEIPPKTEVLSVLSRAYPQVAPGTLTSLTSSGATFALTGSTGTPSCGLSVWIPGSTEPVLQSSGLTDLFLERTSGGWFVTGCAEGDYALSNG